MAGIEHGSIEVEVTRSAYGQSVRIRETVSFSLEAGDKRTEISAGFRQKSIDGVMAAADEAVKRLAEMVPDDQKAGSTPNPSSTSPRSPLRHGEGPTGGAQAGGSDDRDERIPAEAKEGKCRDCQQVIYHMMILKRGKRVTERWDPDGEFHYRTCPEKGV